MSAGEVAIERSTLPYACWLTGRLEWRMGAAPCQQGAVAVGVQCIALHVVAAHMMSRAVKASCTVVL
jgi:hypothetical protein